ncbi:MAG: cell division protein ZipA C-terminal FtsZ-binding domain-containing protein [Candidatus Competibacter sp.]|nr:cell division protein ZipA C-terminal FtsZ-binding domain-containing protein [Candidatus Competibacter sp.]
MEMDKTQLQWLLTGIGIVVVALIYLWGIRSSIKEGIRNRRRRPEREPALGETQAPLAHDDYAPVQHDFGDLGYLTPDHHLADKALVDVEIRTIRRESDPRPALTNAGADAESEPLAPPSPVPEKPPHMTVVLTVMAAPHRPFRGPRIQAVAEELQFRLGASGLFERFADGESSADTPVFSLAHLREPGSFDLQTLHELKTPGLLLFMNLPGPLEGTQALNLLVLTADQWAQKLAGVICDGRRNRMNNRALMHLRDEVSDLEQRLRAWAQAHE